MSIVMPAAVGGSMVKTLAAKVQGHRANRIEEVLQAYPVPKMVLRMEKSEFKGLSTSWATTPVLHALTSRCPKTRCTTTPPGNMIYVLSSCCADRVLEKIIVGICG